MCRVAGRPSPVSDRHSPPPAVQRDERHLPGGQRRGERRGRPARPMAEGEQHAGRHAATHERADEVDGPRVAPVEVVEDEHDGLVLRQQPEQVPHRAMCAMALVAEPGVAGRAPPAQCRKRPSPRRRAAPTTRPAPARRRRRPSPPPRRAYGSSRSNSDAGARQHDVTAVLGAPAQLREQTGSFRSRARPRRRCRPGRLRAGRRGPRRAAGARVADRRSDRSGRARVVASIDPRGRLRVGP